jgi:hypothetical protein
MAVKVVNDQWPTHMYYFILEGTATSQAHALLASKRLPQRLDGAVRASYSRRPAGRIAFARCLLEGCQPAGRAAGLCRGLLAGRKVQQCSVPFRREQNIAHNDVPYGQKRCTGKRLSDRGRNGRHTDPPAGFCG